MFFNCFEIYIIDDGLNAYQIFVVDSWTKKTFRGILGLFVKGEINFGGLMITYKYLSDGPKPIVCQCSGKILSTQNSHSYWSVNTIDEDFGSSDIYKKKTLKELHLCI